MNRKGFTLFELLAVLTVISIGLVVLVGSYGSWGTAHALSSSARVIEAGLHQARALAMSTGSYVGFDYGTRATNEFNTVSGFQIFLCAATNDSASVESILQALPLNPATASLADEDLSITPAAPYQRLSGHVRLGYVRETDIASASPAIIDSVTLFFRPDGSVWSWDDQRGHYMCLYTIERFATGETTGQKAQALRRILRVDLATGLVTIINPEAAP